MTRRPIRTVMLAALVSTAVLLAAGPSPAAAATPTLRASAVVSGFTATVRYRVNVAASRIAVQRCSLLRPGGSVTTRCDTRPDIGSDSTRTRYSIKYLTPKAGTYTFTVRMRLTSGKRLSASTRFVVVPGPAVKFSVTGLVEQENFCRFGVDCADDVYPRQIARITALDVKGNVATGYAGTVSFEDLRTHRTPGGVQPMTLNAGVGYVPVLVPQLEVGSTDGLYGTACPVIQDDDLFHSRTGIVFSVHDTNNPSIFGCHAMRGGGWRIQYPDSFFNVAYQECPAGGCFEDPTGSITIDTNLMPPETLTGDIMNGSALVQGGAGNGNYFRQSYSIGFVAVDSASLGLDVLAPCAQCAPGQKYFLPGTVVDIASTVIDNSDQVGLGRSSLAFNVLTPLPWKPASVPAAATAPLLGAAAPNCAMNTYFTVILTTDLCKQPVPVP